MGTKLSQETPNLDISDFGLHEETKTEPEVEQIISNSIYDRSYVSQSFYDVYSSFNIIEIQEACPICNETVSPENKISLPCHSNFCKECITKYLESKIYDREILIITCPMTGCLFEFTIETLKEYLSKNLLEKYNKLLNDEALSQNPNLR